MGLQIILIAYFYIQLLYIVESDGFDAVSGTDSNKEINVKKTTNTKDKKENTPTDTKEDNRLITDNQRKRLYAISKDVDKMVISDILAKYDFVDSKHITMGKYNAICDEIEGLKNKSLGA